MKIETILAILVSLFTLVISLATIFGWLLGSRLRDADLKTQLLLLSQKLDNFIASNDSSSNSIFTRLKYHSNKIGELDNRTTTLEIHTGLRESRRKSDRREN